MTKPRLKQEVDDHPVNNEKEGVLLMNKNILPDTCDMENGTKVSLFSKTSNVVAKEEVQSYIKLEKMDTEISHSETQSCMNFNEEQNIFMTTNANAKRLGRSSVKVLNYLLLRSFFTEIKYSRIIVVLILSRTVMMIVF